MKKMLKRLLMVVAFTVVLSEISFPAYAWLMCAHGRFDDDVVVTEQNTKNAPLVYGTSLSEGKIATHLESIQTRLSLKQANLEPSLNIVAYRTGTRSIRNIIVSRPTESKCIYMEFMGDLVSNSDLSIDALMSAVKLPEKNGSDWSIDDYFWSFDVEIIQYAGGDHEENIVQWDDFGDNEWWKNWFGEWRYMQDTPPYHSEFPNTIKYPVDESVWIPENIDLVKIMLTASICGEYEHDEVGTTHDIESEIMMVIILSNNYIPVPVGGAETDEPVLEPDDLDHTWHSDHEDGDSLFPRYLDGIDDGAYASDFDELSTKEVAIGSVAVAVVAGGIAAGAVGAAGGGIGKMDSGNGDDSTYVLKDPATGSESLYIYDDATGEWISDDGRTVLDTSRISQWKKDREIDRQAADDAMRNLRSRNTEFDRQMSKSYQEDQEKEKHEDYVNKLGVSHGIYSGNENEIRAKISEEKGKAEIESYEQLEYEKEYEKSQTYAEVTGKIADLTVDAIGATSPALKPVQYTYYGLRNMTANLSDAVVNNKDTISAMRKAVGETVVDITQSSVDKLGYKFAAYTIGDAYKEVLNTIDEGKISVNEMTDATLKGLKDGTKKTIVSGIFEYAEGKFMPNGKVQLKTDTTIKNLTKEASRKSAKLLGAYEGGTISKATYDGAKSVLNAKYVAEVRHIKKMADSYVKVMEKSTKTLGKQYDAASTLLENIACDVVTENNPFKRN